MILAIDIGNSNVVIGIHEDGVWKHLWRLKTVSKETIFYYQMKLSHCFTEEGINTSDIEEIVLSSVVPDLTDKFSAFLREINPSSFILFDRRIYSKLNVSTSNPFEIGTDIMANVIAVHELWHQNTIIVDFGTALTFTLVNKNGEIEGVNIVPGIKTAIKALSSNAAQLHEVSLEFPNNTMGKNTVEAIQNGVLIGYHGLVKHMIDIIQTNKNNRCKVIATGGLSTVIPELVDSFDTIDKYLTLNGLKWIAENCLLLQD